jgi:hypothetical protein
MTPISHGQSTVVKSGGECRAGATMARRMGSASKHPAADGSRLLGGFASAFSSGPSAPKPECYL